jgi:hypothetical protein
VIIAIAAAESIEGLSLPPVPPLEPAYQALAALPPGAVLELPVYSNRFAFLRVRYMLASTAHWKPLVDAYSDYIPKDFLAIEGTLGMFPSRESLALLHPNGGRYAVIHLDSYRPEQKAALFERLHRFKHYLRGAYADDRILVFEVVGAPP